MASHTEALTALTEAVTAYMGAAIDQKLPAIAPTETVKAHTAPVTTQAETETAYIETEKVSPEDP